jgi:ketosteroid isomerase-like protein
MDDVMSAQLRELRDDYEIRSVLHAYARAVDRCDREGLRAVYHDDAIDDHGVYHGLGSDFADHLMDGTLTAYRATSHYLTNMEITVDGDSAVAETYFLAVHDLAAEDGMRLLGGRYVDRLARREGRWRISHRTVVRDWGFQEELGRPWLADAIRPGRRDGDDEIFRAVGGLAPPAPHSR